MKIIIDECRLWLDGREFTRFLRTGTQPLAVVDRGRVVFADSGMHWTPGPTGIQFGQTWRATI